MRTLQRYIATLCCVSAMSACDAMQRRADFQPPPAPDAYVTDAPKILSEGVRRSLDDELAALEKASGRQVLVWIADSLTSQSLEEWSARTFEAWGIGRKGLDDGVCLFIFVQERKARIEVGYGLEEYLTDAAVGRILDTHLIPAMRAGEPDRGVPETVHAILAEIDPERFPPATTPGMQPHHPALFDSFGPRELIVILAFIAFMALSIRHPWLAMFFFSQIRSLFGAGGKSAGFRGGGGRSGGGGGSRSW